MKCKHCGFDNSNQDNYCSRCGQLINPLATPSGAPGYPPAASPRVENDFSAAQIRSFLGRNDAAPSNAAGTVPAANQVVAPNPAVTRKCGFCGFENNYQDLFCFLCGRTLSDDLKRNDRPAQSVAPVPQAIPPREPRNLHQNVTPPPVAVPPVADVVFAAVPPLPAAETGVYTRESFWDNDYDTLFQQAAPTDYQLELAAGAIDFGKAFGASVPNRSGSAEPFLGKDQHPAARSERRLVFTDKNDEIELKMEYIVGNKVGERLLSQQGEVIAEPGQLITLGLIDQADQHGLLAELIVGMILPDMEL